MTETKTRTIIKICKICRDERSDFIRYAQVCNACKEKNVSRCTKCNLVKPRTQFYKNNPYGHCAACKTGNEAGYTRRTAGFAALDPEVQKDIITMLDSRKLYDSTNGREGKRYFKRDICKKYGINESSLSLWIRLGTIKLEVSPTDIEINSEQ